MTVPTLDRVIGSSRSHLVRCYLLDPAGALVAQLPVERGELTGTATPGDRWVGSVQLAGEEWLPTGPTHPLSGFTGHRVRVQLGSTVDTRPVFVTVADLIVGGSRVSRSREDYGHELALYGLAGYVSQAAERSYRPGAGETCQGMIRRVVDANRPPGWPPTTVLDSSAPIPVPSDYAVDGRPAWDVVEDLSTLANVSVFVDPVQRLVIRPALPNTPRTPARTLTTAHDVTGWRLGVGRGSGFGNRVELRCSPVQVSSEVDQLRDDVVGVAEQTTGPLGSGTVGRVVVQAQQLTGAISKAAADARAAALLGPALRSWLTVELDVVPDPRLTIDDDVVVDYGGGSVMHHRITGLALPLTTEQMRVELRTFDDQLPGPLGRHRIVERSPHPPPPRT